MAGQFGQFDIYNFVLSETDNALLALSVAEGWASGWITIYTDDADNQRVGVDISLSWDSEEERDDFLNAFEEVLESHGVDTDELDLDDEMSRWVTTDEHQQHGVLFVSGDGSAGPHPVRE